MKQSKVCIYCPLRVCDWLFSGFPQSDTLLLLLEDQYKCVLVCLIIHHISCSVCPLLGHKTWTTLYFCHSNTSNWWFHQNYDDFVLTKLWSFISKGAPINQPQIIRYIYIWSDQSRSNAWRWNQWLWLSTSHMWENHNRFPPEWDVL